MQPARAREQAREREQERARQVADFQAMIAGGRLRRGMTRAQVRELLGEPSDVGCTSRGYRTPACFKYGEVQLFFGPRAHDGLELVFSEDGAGERGVALALPG